MFTPSILDKAFDVWAKSGVCTFQDLYINNIFVSFDKLVNRFKIPRSHFFRYLQIRNFLVSHTDCFPSYPPTSLLDSIFKIGQDLKQNIGKIYKLLNQHSLANLDHMKNEWEEDLNEQILQTICQNIIKHIYSSSICQRHVVIQFKVVHRLHLSKVRLSRFRL